MHYRTNKNTIADHSYIAPLLLLDKRENKIRMYREKLCVHKKLFGINKNSVRILSAPTNLNCIQYLILEQCYVYTLLIHNLGIR